jgi:hypothetical protein
MLSHTAQIDIRAPTGLAFVVVERDILTVQDDPSSMRGRRPVDAGPMREGLRWALAACLPPVPGRARPYLGRIAAEGALADDRDGLAPFEHVGAAV